MKQPVYCRACGTQFFSDFRDFGGEVCKSECLQELNWRKSLAEGGKPYEPQETKRLRPLPLPRHISIAELKPNESLDESLEILAKVVSVERYLIPRKLHPKSDVDIFRNAPLEARLDFPVVTFWYSDPNQIDRHYGLDSSLKALQLLIKDIARLAA